MSPKAARRKMSVLLLLIVIALRAFPILACSKNSPASPAVSCGSGDVYWDAGVSRCRDHASGEFVKSS